MIGRLAWRYIFSSQRDRFLVVVVRMAFVGIAVGIAALIVVLSVMRGFHKELLNSIVQTESHVSVLMPYGEKSWEPSQQLLQSLAEHEDVVRVLPIMVGQGAFMQAGGMRAVNIRGVAAADLDHEIMMQKWREQRKEEVVLEDHGALIGKNLARDLGVCVGDVVEMVLPQMYTTLMGTVPAIVPVRIAGIVDTKYYMLDTNTVLISGRFGAQIFHTPIHHVHRLDVYVRNPEQLERVRRALEKHHIPASQVSLWFARHASFIQTLQVERVVMTIILTLMILVTGFNVVSGLMMFVRDKRYDTALLRLLGYSSRHMTRLYLASGLMIAMGGVCVGIVLGVLVCANIDSMRRAIESLFQVDLFKEEFYMLGQVPADCGADLIVSIAGVALCVCFCAVWFPARRAAKSQPLECLRYEA